MKRIKRIIASAEAALLLLGSLMLPVGAVTEGTEEIETGEITRYEKAVTTLPDLPLTNNPQIEGLISVAVSQWGIAYDSNHRTKYGEWFGMPTAAWCAFFVSWCANQAGIPTNIIAKMGTTDASWYAENGTLHYFFDQWLKNDQQDRIVKYGIRTTRTAYTPKRGDLVYFKWDTTSDSTTFAHVGIVCGVLDGKVYTVEGNSGSPGSVRFKVYNQATETQIMAYATPNYTPAEEYRPGYYRVKSSSGLNLREGPGTSYTLLDTLPNNTLIRVTEISENGRWGRTVSPSGQAGWICLPYTIRTGDIFAEKVVGPALISVEEGMLFPLGTSVWPEGASDASLTYSVSDKTVLTVDSKGFASAKKTGTAAVTSTDSAGHSLTTSVTVVPRSPAGTFSEWLTVLPEKAADAERTTESRTAYRSRVYEEISSYSPDPIEGYESLGPAVEYSDWSEPVTVREKPVETDLLDITKTEEFYVYYHYHNVYDTGKNGIDSIPVGESAEYEECILHAALPTSTMSDKGGQQAYYDDHSTCANGYHSWFLKESYTEYTYSTRTSQTVYTFAKDSGWSDWSTEKPTGGDGVTVETMEAVRYLDDKIVSLRLVSGPRVTEAPARKDLDTTGLVLEATYASGAKKQITSGYTIEGFDPGKEGTQTPSAVYLTKKVPFTVKVVDMDPAVLCADALSGLWKSTQTASLRVKSNHGVSSFRLTVAYDASSLLPGTPIAEQGKIKVVESASGKLVLTFTSDSLLSSEDTIISLPVTILRGAEIGKCTLTLSVADAIGKEGSPIRLDTENVTVNVQKESSHSFVTEVRREPTCSREGLRVKTCKICDAVVEEAIPKTEHTYTSSITVKPTCAVKGERTFTCTACGASYTESIPMVAHVYVDVVTVPPTCTKMGTMTHRCTGCTASYTTPISSTGHHYEQTASVAPTCAKDGYTEKTCTGCGDVIRTAIPKIEHTYRIQVVKPEGGAQGYTEYICTACGYTYRDTYTAPAARRVVFLWDDGTEYFSAEQYDGESVRLPEQPEKEKTAQYTFAFAGWEGYTDRMTVTKDLTFKAKFSSAVNEYSVLIADEKGTVYLSQTLPYGAKVPLPKTEPSRGETTAYRYEFKGYDGYTEGMTVKGDVKLTVLFEEIRKYPEKITSSLYKIERDKGMIRRIGLGTNASEFLSKFGGDAEFLSLTKGGKAVSSSDPVSTGMTLTLSGGGKTLETLEVCLTGDPNGDGGVTLADYVLIKAHLMNKSTLKNAAFAAADLNGDGAVTLADYVLLRAYLLKKADITPR